MKLTTAGVAVGFDRQIVGIVTTSPLQPEQRHNRILVGGFLPEDLSGYRGALTTGDLGHRQLATPAVHRTREIVPMTSSSWSPHLGLFVPFIGPQTHTTQSS